MTKTSMNYNLQPQQQINFHEYWLILKRRWLPITVITASIISLTGVYVLNKKPVYEAEGKLRFDKTSGASSLTGLTEQLGQLSGLTQLSNPLETEAEVIRSRDVIQKTIDDLNLRDKQGKLIKVEDFTKILKVKSLRGTDVLQLNYSSNDSKESANIINKLIENYLKNNIDGNRAQAKAAREFLSRQLPEVEQQVSRAEDDVRIFKEKNKVISLTQEAAAGVDTLKELSNQITETQSKLVAAKTRSQALQSQLSLTTQQAFKLSSLSQNVGLQQLLAEYQKIENQLAAAQSSLTDEHPTVIDLKKKAQAFKEKLQQKVTKTIDSEQIVPEDDLQQGKLKEELTAQLIGAEVERLALENQITLLNQSLLLYQQRLSGLPKLEKKQRELERKLQVAQGTYQQLLKQLQEVRVLENQNVGNARIISLAVPPEKPLSSQRMLNLLAGGAFGVVLGIIVALTLELMDVSLKTVDQTKKLLKYPLLGTIPQLNKKDNKKLNQELSELPVLNNPYSALTSAFEILETNLSFSSNEKNLKIIVVSSSVPGEGKSFTSANLAVTICQLGKRVLLIDADMRRPRQQEIWNLPNIQGLSNVLVGRNSLKGSAQEVLASLDILTAGTIPPNPLGLIDSKEMESLVKQVSQNYDFIIIDAPPITAVADALKLNQLAQGMLLVVRPGVATTDSVSSVKNQLEQSGQRILGVVINGVTEKSSYGGYYKSGSYYGKQHKQKTNQEKKVSTSTIS
jgi:polysaccharide biosynthesis transport protein